MTNDLQHDRLYLRSKQKLTITQKEEKIMYLDLIKKQKDIPMKKYFNSEDYKGSWDGFVISLRSAVSRKIDGRKGVYNNFKKMRTA